ncbi:helix-turn-helix domain-containing protein [Actinomadura luteofluorescens]|uniref:helix-turn-helix domain-containing protein n=1 Tax=Actinomadura luteofluorescens TaxID=46163 RepID=UPI0034803407
MSDNRARVFFGNELRRMREHGGLTGKQLADALGCTPQWISTMESGRKVSEQSAHDLDTYFRTDGIFHRLWRLANEVDVPITLPPGFAEYQQRERQANAIRVYSSLLVNGLFQTEGYIRSVMASVDDSDVDEFIQERLRRQEALTRRDRPHIWFSLDEGVLRRAIGGTEVLREQLRYLIELGKQPNTMVQVVPQTVGYYPGLTGSFTLLGFKDGTNAAYTESAGTGILIEQPSRVSEYVVRYDSVRGYALSIGESRALISAVMESL